MTCLYDIQKSLKVHTFKFIIKQLKLFNKYNIQISSSLENIRYSRIVNRMTIFYLHFTNRVNKTSKMLFIFSIKIYSFMRYFVKYRVILAKQNNSRFEISTIFFFIILVVALFFYHFRRRIIFFINFLLFYFAFNLIFINQEINSYSRTRRNYNQ